MPFYVSEWNARGRATQPSGITSVLPKLDNVLQGRLSEGHATLPTIHFLMWLEECILKPDGWPIRRTPLTQEFPMSHDGLCVYSGALIPRGLNRQRMPLIDECGNRHMPELSTWIRESGTGAIAFNHLTMTQDYKDEILQYCDKIEDILVCNGIRWPAYAALWRAVHDISQKTDTPPKGSIRQWILEELMTFGLARPVTTTEYKRANPNLQLQRGRPPTLLLPTSWGTKLVELCDKEGIEIPKGVFGTISRYSKPRLVDRAAIMRIAKSLPHGFEKLEDLDGADRETIQDVLNGQYITKSNEKKTKSNMPQDDAYFTESNEETTDREVRDDNGDLVYQWSEADLQGMAQLRAIQEEMDREARSGISPDDLWLTQLADTVAEADPRTDH